MQNSYLKILEGKAIYKQQASFKTFLFSVIRFTAYDLNKSERRYQSLEQLKVVTEEVQEAPVDSYRQILEQLPKQQQQVLLMAFYHNLTLAEIAEVMDLHIGTVRTHYERGKSSLRSLIKKNRE